MKNIHRIFYIFIFIFSASFAEITTQDNINVNNIILAKVEDNTISVMDLTKKMDLAYRRAYPDLINSAPSRYQFYSSSWKYVLDEIINTELVLADSKTKELQISDGEIREDLERRFGPNIMLSINQLNLTYDEAWKIVKNDLIVQRMTWFYVHAKALNNVTPQIIRQAYRLYCIDNPPLEQWSYQVISIRSNDEKIGKELAEKTFILLKNEKDSPLTFNEKLKEIEKDYENSTINISNLYEVENKKLADSHKSILQNLDKKSYSNIITQTSRVDNKTVHRIFYLNDYIKNELPSFEEMSNNLKNELLEKSVAEESKSYYDKLRQKFHFEENSLPEDFQPFSFE